MSDDFERIGIKLRAVNSSGDQTLEVLRQNNTEYFFSLYGDYEGKHIQIDFDMFNLGDLECMLELIKKERIK